MSPDICIFFVILHFYQSRLETSKYESESKLPAPYIFLNCHNANLSLYFKISKDWIRANMKEGVNGGHLVSPIVCLYIFLDCQDNADVITGSLHHLQLYPVKDC